MTLTERVLRWVELHPGHTAWEITKSLAAKDGSDPRFLTGSVSSLLCQLTKAKRVRRLKSIKGSWIYWGWV